MGRKHKREAAEVTTHQGTMPGNHTREDVTRACTWEIPKLPQAVSPAVGGSIQKCLGKSKYVGRVQRISGTWTG